MQSSKKQKNHSPAAPMPQPAQTIPALPLAPQATINLQVAPPVHLRKLGSSQLKPYLSDLIKMKELCELMGEAYKFYCDAVLPHMAGKKLSCDGYLVKAHGNRYSHRVDVGLIGETLQKNFNITPETYGGIKAASMRMGHVSAHLSITKKKAKAAAVPKDELAETTVGASLTDEAKTPAPVRNTAASCSKVA